MRLTQVLAAAGLAGLVTGCMTQASLPPVTPEMQARMLDDLRAGVLALDCGAACSATWTAELGSVRAFDSADRYADLAVRVMQIRYGSDLAYYYLGRAAQGLGDYTAAITYYRHSLDLANGTNPALRCEAAGADACQGVDLASSIPVLVQASQRELAESTAHTTVRRRPTHVTPASTGPGWVAPPPPADTTSGTTASGGPGWAAPPPPPSASAAPASTGSGSGSGWVAPPPAH